MSAGSALAASIHSCISGSDMIMGLPEMQEWIEAAKAEPADIEELEVEY